MAAARNYLLDNGDFGSTTRHATTFAKLLMTANFRCLFVWDIRKWNNKRDGMNCELIQEFPRVLKTFVLSERAYQIPFFSRPPKGHKKYRKTAKYEPERWLTRGNLGTLQQRSGGKNIIILVKKYHSCFQQFFFGSKFFSFFYQIFCHLISYEISLDLKKKQKNIFPFQVRQRKHGYDWEGETAKYGNYEKIARRASDDDDSEMEENMTRLNYLKLNNPVLMRKPIRMRRKYLLRAREEALNISRNMPNFNKDQFDQDYPEIVSENIIK